MEKYYKKARKVLKTGFDKFPSNPDLGVTISWFYEDPQVKSDFLKHLLKENPNSLEIMDELAYLLRFTHNVTESIYYSELLRLIEKDVTISQNESRFIFSNYKDAFTFENENFRFKYNLIYLDLHKMLHQSQTQKMVLLFLSNKISVVEKTVFSEKLERLYKNAAYNMKEFNFDNLVKIRKNFIKLYYMYEEDQMNTDKLFAFHKTLIEQNLFEAYNYWLFRYGIGEEVFNKWYADHKEDYQIIEGIVQNRFRS